jgi:hypothetical protein
MKTLKKILAVAVMAASAQSAFAYWDSGVDTVNKSNPNDGEAILTIWDPVAQKSYSQDLGIKYSQLYSGAAFSGTGTTITLDATALSVFGGSFADANWNISAANSHVKNGTANAYAGAGYLFSYKSGDVIATPAGIGTNVNTKWAQFNPYQTNLAMGNPAVAGNQVRSGTAAGFAETGYQADWADYITGVSAYDSVNNAMNLWFVGYANATGTQGTTKNLGRIVLNVSGGTLTFAPEVPVPGAAWLMGSALVGLAGVGRSRKQRA